MRIVSQDRTFDVNYDDIAIWIVGDHEDNKKYRIQCTYQGEIFDLGIYNSKERALELMREIRNNYIKFKYVISTMASTASQIHNSKDVDTGIDIFKISVFEMPLE